MDNRVSQLSQPIILLSRGDLAGLMPFGAYVQSVAEAFRLHAQGRTVLPAPMHVPAEAGGFHVKAGGLPTGYVAFKVNANFPNNRAVNALPTIQGAILLFNSKTGSPVALIDSIEITIKRTGAATAVAARHLARPDARVATVVGCGEQGRIQLEALRHVLELERVFLFDSNPDAAADLAAEIEGVDVEIVPSLRDATLESDVIVTCTSAKVPFLRPDDVRPGTFIAAIGADNPEKSEIEPALMARARVITDVTAQAAHMGDLNHAIRAGAMREADVHAEIGEIINGRKSGRANLSEITIFDGTGVGIQDVAASVRAYELARERGAGTRVDLG
ncbi:MAG TPA: ornithine cyclodeaminase family protein [Beijerinckiaceae bacterium]|jgi:alanine dehydrogenase|nr:ornithine cyclodeaminase family protein [Beijerinckiaceae bacterium]